MSSRCFSTYQGYDSYDYALYACTVVMLAVYLGTVIAFCVVRRRTGPGKHLIGLPYMAALLFVFIEKAGTFISATLNFCEVPRGLKRFVDWNIASSVFYGLNTFLLLFVVIYTLNTMLRKQLGHNSSALKVVIGIDLFVLGGLLLSYVVLQSYLIWHLTGVYTTGASDSTINIMSPMYVLLAFDAVFLVTILVSGALSVVAARTLTRKYGASNSFMIWILILIASLVGYTMIGIIAISTQISFIHRLGPVSTLVMSWISDLFCGLAHITLIVIATNPVWRSNAFAASTAEQNHWYNQ